MGKTIRRKKDYWNDDPYEPNWKSKKKKMVKKNQRNRKIDNDRAGQDSIHYR